MVHYCKGPFGKRTVFSALLWREGRVRLILTLFTQSPVLLQPNGAFQFDALPSRCQSSMLSEGWNIICQKLKDIPLYAMRYRDVLAKISFAWVLKSDMEGNGNQCSRNAVYYSVKGKSEARQMRSIALVQIRRHVWGAKWCVGIIKSNQLGASRVKKPREPASFFDIRGPEFRARNPELAWPYTQFEI